MTTSGQFDPPPRFLMCRPQHFAVTYSINPWMDPAAWHESGDALHATAMRQWQGLFRALRAGGASVELVRMAEPRDPQDGLPDAAAGRGTGLCCGLPCLARAGFD